MDALSVAISFRGHGSVLMLRGLEAVLLLLLASREVPSTD